MDNKTEYAAHIDKNGNIQSVEEHCIQTGKLCMKYAKRFGAENIGKTAGLLHDAGKFTRLFNDYIRGNTAKRRGEIDHSYAGAKYIHDFGEKIGYVNVCDLIARTIISHHGIHDWINEDFENYFSVRTNKSGGYEEIKENLKRMLPDEELSELIRKAGSEYDLISDKISKISDKKERAFYLGMFERLLQSALIDADVSDTVSFMDKCPADEEKDGEIWNTSLENMNKRLESFSEKSDPISLQRKSISERCNKFADHDVGICRLTVPTGGGKTLSSLRFALKYAKNHDMERIIYVAPFMSILEQNSDEIRNVVGDDNFIEHYSDALANISDDTDCEQYKEYELHTQKWDSPVIATTMVQFLNSLFSSKKSSVRRMHRLCRSVIIIDEIQSIPLKCVNLFNLAMNFLSKTAGSVIVLCSATQPANIRLDNNKKNKSFYPLLLDENYSMTGDYTEDFKIFHRCEIISEITPSGMDYDEASDFCYKKFNESGNLLVIVNTKSSALNIYERLKQKCTDDTEIVHLSTNMCPEHRREKIAYLKKLLNENKKVICVTTSLIEAGVDISFKCVVRSLAGLDSAAQAAGRCNRHGENSEICNVYIIKIRDENLGSLVSIKNAQGVSVNVIDYNHGCDLQSPEIIEQYFIGLYRDEIKNLSYNTVDCGNETTLLNLLSLNKVRREMCDDAPDINASQAFKTAGTIFEVIDNNTVDVVVPFNDDAREIIEKLENTECDLKNLLRRVQKYTVSLYCNTKNKLTENNALRLLDTGVIVLDERYYDDVKGVITEEAEKEVLIY